MSFEEEIKQKEFESEHQKALLNILYTSNHITNKMSLFFKAHNITRQQYNGATYSQGATAQACLHQPDQRPYVRQNV